MTTPAYDNPDFFMKLLNQYTLDSFMAKISRDESLVIPPKEEKNQDLSAKIIIWSYNRPNLLKSAIISVLNQEYDNMDIFIIDDGSDIFDPREIQEEFQDSRLVIAQADQIGLEERAERSRLGENTNFVIETFNHDDIIYYLCDDDIMAEKWIQRSMYVFRNTESHVVQGQTYLFGDDMETKLAGFEYQSAGALYMIAGSFAHKAACFFDEGIRWEDNDHLHSQDAAFIREMLSRHEDIIISTCPSLFRRIHDKNLSNLLPDLGGFQARDGKITKEMLESNIYE